VRFPDISGARKAAQEAVRTALEERSAVLGAVSPDGSTAELAEAYRDAYRWRARRAAFEERVELCAAPLLLLLIFGPLVLATFLLSGRTGAKAATEAFTAGWVFGGLLLLGVLVIYESLQRVALVVFALALLATSTAVWRGIDVVTALTSRPWLAAVTGCIALPMVSFAAAIPIAFTSVWLVDRYGRSQPHRALLVSLFGLAATLADPRALQDRRASLLRKVNASATVLETTFWRKQVRLSNPQSRATWRNRCRQCATHLRSFDLAIVLPRHDTREYLLGEVVSLIHVLLRGTLDELPTAETRPRRRLAAFGSAVRSLLLGLVPLGLVLAARYAAHLAGIQLPAGLASALGIGALAWFGLVVLMTFDSQAANRMALLRDAADALSKFRSKP
jgi:hypothetical protein